MKTDRGAVIESCLDSSDGVVFCRYQEHLDIGTESIEEVSAKWNTLIDDQELHAVGLRVSSGCRFGYRESWKEHERCR